jgi:hypothetical protein
MHRAFEEGMSEAKTCVLSPSEGPRDIYPALSTAAGLVDLQNDHDTRLECKQRMRQPTCVEFQEVVYFLCVQLWFRAEA